MLVNIPDVAFVAWISASVVGHTMNCRCFAASAPDTSLIMRETVDLGKPTVSPITCKKLPQKIAKQPVFARLATRHGFEQYAAGDRPAVGLPENRSILCRTESGQGAVAR